MTIFFFSAFLLLGVSALLNFVADDGMPEGGTEFPYTRIQEGDVL